MSRIRANQITNQSADGAPTVQNGLVISGVTTSTTFSGSGASLTNLPTQVTISNNADNRIITGGSGVNLNGETNLTWDATTLKVQAATPAIEISGTNSNGGNSSLHFNANANHWVLEADNYTQQNLFSIKSGTTSSSTPRLIINPNGGVGINTSNFSSKLNNEAGLAIHGSSNDNCRISFTTPTKSNPGSSIGYFGLNRFGIDTYDGIEFRDVTRSYATIFKIDQNGYMTTNQPYGYVRFNAINDTGGENRQTDVNTHTVENGMSHSGGRLTVPATGKYYIGIHGNILDNGNAAQYLYINGSKTDGFRWQQSDSDQYWKSSMVGGIINLSANDYLDIYVVGKQDSAAWNVWSVYMLG